MSEMLLDALVDAARRRPCPTSTLVDHRKWSRDEGARVSNAPLAEDQASEILTPQCSSSRLAVVLGVRIRETPEDGIAAEGYPLA